MLIKELERTVSFQDQIPFCDVELRGHILDSLTLPKVLDTINDNKGNFEITKMEVGHAKSDLSFASLRISATTAERLEAIINIIQKQGAQKVA